MAAMHTEVFVLGLLLQSVGGEQRLLSNLEGFVRMCKCRCEREFKEETKGRGVGTQKRPYPRPRGRKEWRYGKALSHGTSN